MRYATKMCPVASFPCSTYMGRKFRTLTIRLQSIEYVESCNRERIIDPYKNCWVLLQYWRPLTLNADAGILDIDARTKITPWDRYKPVLRVWGFDGSCPFSYFRANLRTLFAGERATKRQATLQKYATETILSTNWPDEGSPHLKRALHFRRHFRRRL